MNTLTFVAVVLLALPACLVREPTSAARTPSQVIARVLAARWWEPAAWLACVAIGPFVVAGWWAGRAAVFNVSALAALLLAKVATTTSADGRTYRLTRTDGMRALVS
ncbi:hypothetical protein FH608_045915 [Nonomuraea phyllanthi]|uniref:Uncharacterized protein n=1 Tax=Nonomuraea phyllanthi TaxID=2219224 RepID=A0A8E0T1Q3_9ACTN|nr:hypothetical protein FH608_045915 [Nonomuraea phyllanthi]